MRRPLSAVACALLLVAAACGQKPGVIDDVPVNASGEAIIDPLAGGPMTTPTTGPAGSLPGSGAVGTTGKGPGGPTTSGGVRTTTGPTPTGRTPSGPTPPGAPTGGNTTGVGDDGLTIGIHAPITGAAPVPAGAFVSGSKLYWDWLRRNDQPINGRHVRVEWRNDNFNPSTAVAQCKDLVEEEKVFLLVGVAGADQIQACARYAYSVGVPYLSAGVTEQQVSTLPNYFSLWATYPEQGPLLADLLVSKLGAKGETNGMVRFNTQSFQDGHDAWMAAMKRAGASVTYDRAVPKTAGQTEASAVATEIAQQKIDNVYVLASPTFFIQLANETANQGWKPQWVGIGLTMGIDTVPNVACRNQRSIDNARFLNPFPAVVDSNRFDPNFTRAGGRTDTSNGSIEFGLWGISKVIAEMLELPGRNLTRERLTWFAERATNVRTGVLPPVSFSPTDHFGGSQMHLVRADCDQGRWVTEQAFASGF